MSTSNLNEESASRKKRTKNAKRCFVCGSVAKFRCDACKKAYYCSEKCQIVDWNSRHSKSCSASPPLRRIKTPPPTPKRKRRDKISLASAVRGASSSSSPPPAFPLAPPSKIDDNRGSADISLILSAGAKTGVAADERGRSTACGADIVETPPVCMRQGEKWGAFRTNKFAMTPFDLSKYPIVAGLGSGAYGSVTRRKFDKGEIAVKILDLDGPDAVGVTRGELSSNIVHEVEIRNFDHRNIAGSCMAGVTADDPLKFAIAMDVGIGNLREYIAKMSAVAPGSAPFDELETAFVIYQVFKGIAHQHEALVINFDVKPQNILVHEIGVPDDKMPIRLRGARASRTMLHVEIIDFGLSMPYRVMHEVVTPQYTRWYCPPEYLLGNKWGTYGGDAWAAGAVAYEIATGLTLFPEDTTDQMISAILAICGAPPVALRTKWFPDWNGITHPETTENFDGIIGAKLAQRGHPKSLARMIRGLLNIDPTKRTTIFEALNDPYFAETGAAELWTNVFGNDPALGYRPALLSKEGGEVDPRWALGVFLERHLKFKKMMEKMNPNVATDFAMRVPKAGGNLKLAVRLIFFLGAAIREGFMPLYAAVALLHRYAATIGADEFGKDTTRAYVAAAACHRLARKYRTTIGVISSDDYSKAMAAWGVSCTADGILEVEQKIAETIDYDFSQPSVYDFMKQLANLNGMKHADEVPSDVDPNATIKVTDEFAVAALAGAFTLMDAAAPVFSVAEAALINLAFAGELPRTNAKTAGTMHDAIAKRIASGEFASAVGDSMGKYPHSSSGEVGWINFAKKWEPAYPGIYDALSIAHAGRFVDAR